MNFVFPMAVMANTFAMTALMIALGLSDKSILAAEIGMVQGATLALFFSFSANARSLILNKASPVSARSMTLARLWLIFPLSVASYHLSIGATGAESSLIYILIFRRCSEWLSDVHLAELERLDDQKNAQLYLALQTASLVLAFIWLIFDINTSWYGLWLWALLPLLFASKFIWKCISTTSGKFVGLFTNLLPHLGSTTIIGITVYVFRLLILLLTGKEMAGDLFTAFAIGGLAGSIFANALGASITLYEQRNGKRHFPPVLRLSLNISLISGICISIIAALQLPFLAITGKSSLFWLATGLSLIGGVVMVYAQQARFRLLHHDIDQDVFGPDVMINILLIAAIPFCFYLLGLQAMTGLYLLSAILSFMFYSFHEKCKKNLMSKSIFSREKLGFILAFMLLFPLFLQVKGNVFHDPSMIFDSGGSLSNLPIPWSVLACYGGILILGDYRRSSISLSVVFFSFILMLIASVMVAGGEESLAQSKLILMIQFILPMFSLVLGQQFGVTESAGSVSIAKAFLFTLILVIPVQLIHSWKMGLFFLSPDVYLFSIYQHLQYVPVLFCAAFLIAIFSLWHIQNLRILLLIMTPIMGIYAAASLSMLATAFLIAGLATFAVFHIKSDTKQISLLVFLMSLLAACGYFYLEKSTVSWKFEFSNSHQDTTLPNIRTRLYYWHYYYDAVTSNLKEFLFGHSKPADRIKYPSAHNYYLDFIYNFGALALLPLLFLIGHTVAITYKCRQVILKSSSLLGLTGVVLFLIFADNSMKVGFRQPYPGILSFFLWGVLLSRLSIFQSDR